MIDPATQNMLRHRFNPDGSELRRMQMRLFEMLCYFDDFCKKHDIEYWLSSGTLIGAVRHRGFVPWDDDLDVELTPEGYRKLLELAPEFESEQFTLQDFKLDHEYISPSGKMRDKHSFLKEIHNRDNFFRHRGLFIDLFVREHGSFIGTRITHVAQYASYALTNMRAAWLRKPLKLMLYGAMHGILFPVMKGYNKLFGEKDRLRHILGNSFYKTIPADCLFPLETIEFEGRKFPAPHNCDAYLSAIYGNYKELPPLDNLRHHTLDLKIW